MDPAASLCKVPDGLTAGLVPDQWFQVLLRIAARQHEQVDALKVGHVCLRVESTDGREAVQGFLIDEGETLGIARQEDGIFPAWERFVPSVGIFCSQCGNIFPA